MANLTRSDALRTLIREVGQTKVAKKANVSAATMSDFMTGKTQHFRMDTEQRVIEALEVLRGTQAAEQMNSHALQDIVDAWEHLDEDQRAMVAQTAKMLASKK